MRFWPLPVSFDVARKLQPEDIYGVMRRHRRALLAGEQRAVEDLLRAWKVAERGIRRRLDDVTKLIQGALASGADVSPAWLYQQERWLAFLATVQSNVSQYSESAEKTAMKQTARSIKAGVADSLELMRATGVSASFTTLPASAFEDLVGAFADGSPLRDLFKEFGGQALMAAQRVMLEGLAAGENPRKIARALAKRIDSLAPRRAVLIARTESIRVYTTAQQRNYEANSDVVTGMRIVSARDSRTCPMCLAQDGKTLKHGEVFHRHPGCRCGLQPIVEGLDIDRGTGEEWLRRQPERVAMAKLGPGRFKLWKHGKIGLEDIYQETQHPRWGPGLRMKRIDEILADVSSGRAKGGSLGGGGGEPPSGPEWGSVVEFVKLGGKRLKEAKHALDVISSLHSLEPMANAKVPVVPSQSKRFNGAFSWNRFGAGRLRLSNPDGCALTFSHEWGHAIDLWNGKSFGPGPSINPGVTDPVKLAAFKQFSDAAWYTGEIQTMVSALETGYLDVPGTGPRWFTISEAEHMEYLLKLPEVWARAYAQYVAHRSKDRLLTEQLEELLTGKRDGIYGRLSQWHPDDFEPIARAVEAVLDAWGFKKK